jgi:hypothetical protein
MLLKLPRNFNQMWITSALDRIILHSMKPKTHDLSPSHMLKPHAPQKSFTLYMRHKLMQANHDFPNKSEKHNCILPLQRNFRRIFSCPSSQPRRFIKFFHLDSYKFVSGFLTNPIQHFSCYPRPLLVALITR